MTHCGLLLLAGAGLLVNASRSLGLEPGAAGPEEARRTRTQKNDLVRVSGAFTVIHFESEGEKFPAAALQQMKVIQKESEWTFEIGGVLTRGRDTIVLGGHPVSHIDCVYMDGSLKGQKVLGIFTVQGDRITYCWAEPGQARPTSFATGPSTGLTLFVLQRVPAAQPQPKKAP